jgi:16S rRNA (cytosine1402-N4)-methyltransferase
LLVGQILARAGSALSAASGAARIVQMVGREDLERKRIRRPRASDRQGPCAWREQARCAVGGGAMTKPVSSAAGHDPVLLEEVLVALAVRPGGVYLDATFGVGGYSKAILAAGAGRVLAIDRDPAAVERGRAIARDLPNLTMIQGRFADAAALLGDHGVMRLDGAVFDLGVCSTQLEDAARGFSFTRDGPLDMRMSGEGLTAADVVNRTDEAGLATILYRYGEERASRRIARAIVERREQAPLRTTGELASLIGGVLGRRGDRIDPATRSFQALRIYVNDELVELERGLAALPDLLAPGGRLVVVSFHSLEDRLVKRFLAEHGDRQARPSRHLPDLPAAQPAIFRRLHGGAIRPRPAEIAANPRARSARLRAAERLAAPVREDTP